jgi:ABC-type dipeptide/oligopeptide/nickel transport system permease component
VLGLALGILAALRRSTWLDTAATAISVVGLSTPTYWSGLVAILLFSLYLRWLPATGEGDLRHLILPALVLGFALSGSIARLVRARVVEVMEEPFVLTARARGIPSWRVLLVHVLRPALPSALTVVALQLGFLLGGAVVTESVFARRGLGKLAVEAILWRDLPVVQGVVMVGALAYVLVNLIADLVETWLIPRLREELT